MGDRQNAGGGFTKGILKPLCKTDKVSLGAR